MAFNRSHPGEAHYKAKLVLRWLALILTIIAIALTVYARAFSWPMWIPLFLSFIWNIANIARRLSAPTPIHPGANVAIDLIIWLTFVSTLLWTYVVGAAALYISMDNVLSKDYSGFYDSVINSSGYHYSGSSSSSSNDITTSNPDLSSFPSTSSTCNPAIESCLGARAVDIDQAVIDTLHRLAIVALVAAVIGTLDFIFHFVLFVYACIDTHRYRHSDRYPEYRRRDYEKMPPQQQPFLPQVNNGAYAQQGYDYRAGPQPVYQGHV